ncbi:MAG: hypothetical protein H0X38_14240, partial [Planctomycetes bacterium]|nr:hypothetical protein [Planctomycetota bacterium]
RGGVLRILRVDASGAVPQPAVFAQADFGAMAAQVAAAAMNADKDQGAVPITIPGAAEAVQNVADASLIARVGQLLLLGAHLAPAELIPVKPPVSDADVQASISGARYFEIIKQMASKTPGFDAKNLDAFAGYIGDMDYQLRIVPEGVLERFTSTTVGPGTKPVDRALLARLPANALLVLGFGTDGKTYWKQLRTPLLTAFAKQAGTTADELEAKVDQQFAGMGLTCTLAQLVEGYTGTTLFAVTPSAPFPAVTLALPRSPALDQVIGLLLDKLQTAAPAEGTATLLPIPNVPVPVQIGLDKTTWLITSDPQLAPGFTTGKPGGWADGPTGSLALSKATPDSVVVGGSDTGNVLRMLTQFAGIGLASRQDLSPQQRQAILQGLAKAASLAAPGYVVAGTKDGHTVVEDRGLFGMGPIAALGLIGSLAQGGGGHEKAALAALKGIVPAELSFQAGAYVDQDGNGSGEFGLLSELGGARATANAPQGTLSLVNETLAAGEAGGYSFTVFLPDGAGAALGEPDGADPRPAAKPAAKEQEQHFVAYAWPTNGAKGQMLAVTEAGTVYAAPSTGEAPNWNALFGGQGWGSAPTWKPYGKGNRPAAGAGKPARPTPAPAPGGKIDP